MNLARHPAERRWKATPSYWLTCLAVKGSTGSPRPILAHRTTNKDAAQHIEGGRYRFCQGRPILIAA